MLKQIPSNKQGHGEEGILILITSIPSPKRPLFYRTKRKVALTHCHRLASSLSQAGLILAYDLAAIA